MAKRSIGARSRSWIGGTRRTVMWTIFFFLSVLWYLVFSSLSFWGFPLLFWYLVLAPLCSSSSFYFGV